MQEMNKEKRANPTLSAYKQTESKRKLRIERMWPEVNTRLNYPLKDALVNMCDNDIIDMDDPVTHYCTLQLCIALCKIGMERIISGWNAHRIPGVGVPNELAFDNYGSPTITEDDFPTASIAANLYSSTLGGHLNEESVFARCPFITTLQQETCQQEFSRAFPDIEMILNCVVNKRPNIFQDSLQYLIDRTRANSS